MIESATYTFPPNITPTGSYYIHPEHGRLVRTTAFLKAYGGKGEGLIKWAEAQGQKLTIKVAHELYTQSPGPIANFGAAVESRLGGARASEETKQRAADIGTAIHKRIHADLTGATPPVLTEHSTIGYMAYRKWFDQAGIIPVKAEQFVFCPRLKAGGTIDLFAVRDGRLGIVDYKSSKGIYEDHHLQLMAYIIMSRSLGLPVEWAEIIHLPKTLENAFKPIVPIPLGEFSWWGGKPQRVTVAWDKLEGCVRSARYLYRYMMEEVTPPQET
jgi:hypothetical protein